MLHLNKLSWKLIRARSRKHPIKPATAASFIIVDLIERSGAAVSGVGRLSSVCSDKPFVSVTFQRLLIA